MPRINPGWRREACLRGIGPFQVRTLTRNHTVDEPADVVRGGGGLRVCFPREPALSSELQHRMMAGGVFSAAGFAPAFVAGRGFGSGCRYSGTTASCRWFGAATAGLTLAPLSLGAAGALFRSEAPLPACGAGAAANRASASNPAGVSTVPVSTPHFDSRRIGIPSRPDVIHFNHPETFGLTIPVGSRSGLGSGRRGSGR